MESLQKKRAMSTLKEEDDGINNDKLSSLPDSVLITIISFLPINVAAATSVLSRRWRNIWTHTTHLSVTPTPDNFQCFVTTMNHVISQLKSPKIHTFDLRLPMHLSTYTRNAISSDFLVPSIRQICLRNPEVIKVNFAAYSRSPYLFQLPHCLLETQSLVELQLHGNLELNFLHDRVLSFKFPYLKKLTLVLNDRNGALIGKNGNLFRACPLLEDLKLSLKFYKDDHIVDIATPNLKCLQIVAATGRLKDCKFVIDAPKLEKCDIKGYLGFYKFVSNPSNLQEVMVGIQEICFGGDNIYISKIRGLIQGISCARSLVFENSEVYLLGSTSFSDLNARPIFHNLTHLTFSYDGDWLDELPACFSLGNLRIVDIRDVGYNDVEINLVQHILRNANVLEQLRISIAVNIVAKDQLQKEYEFCKQLFMLRKSSVNCQIEFYGLAIIASSKDFGDDRVLSCQIRNH